MSQRTKKKKQPKNAFYFFFIEYKKNQEDRGVRFPGGIKEVTQKAAPLWEKLDAREKWIYEEEARKEKQRDKSNLDNKFTSLGKSYAEVEREKKEEMEEYQKMMHEISSTVRSLECSKVAFVSHPFHVIHVNYYCKSMNGMYTPCELAIAEFTFADGVRRTYHTLINPGDIPLGYQFEANKFSVDTHQIPVPPDDNGGERNYFEIFQKIKRFLTGSNDANAEMPPLYTLQNLIEPVKNVLGNLQEDGAVDIFKVYQLPRLFFELRNASVSSPGAPGFPAYSLAESELDKDVFNFTLGISCDFHEDTDALPYCSLSCVRRWCFLIMDHCCKDLGIDLLPGTHCPKQADVSRLKKMSSRPSSVAGDDHRSNASFKSGAVDHGRLSSEPRSEQHFTLGFTPAVVTRKPEPKKPVKPVLEPLRLPKTQSQALSSMSVPNFCEEDFPPIGAPKGRGEALGVRKDAPVLVAGRGRSTLLYETPVTVGRGRKLAPDFKLDEELNELKL